MIISNVQERQKRESKKKVAEREKEKRKKRKKKRKGETEKIKSKKTRSDVLAVMLNEFKQSHQMPISTFHHLHSSSAFS